MALYHLNEGAGNVVHDMSGNDCDGIMIDTTWIPRPE